MKIVWKNLDSKNVPLSQRNHTETLWVEPYSENHHHEKCTALRTRLDQTYLYRKHAFGDQYKATDAIITGKGKLTMTFTPEDGSEATTWEVYDFQENGSP